MMDALFVCALTLALVLASCVGVDGYKPREYVRGKPPPPAQRIERADIPVDFEHTGRDAEYMHGAHCIDGRTF